MKDKHLLTSHTYKWPRQNKARLQSTLPVAHICSPPNTLSLAQRIVASVSSATFQWAVSATENLCTLLALKTKLHPASYVQEVSVHILRQPCNSLQSLAEHPQVAQHQWLHYMAWLVTCRLEFIDKKISEPTMSELLAVLQLVSNCTTESPCGLQDLKKKVSGQAKLYIHWNIQRDINKQV